MPDTGAPWNIPYVAGTDLVRDWPTDSQELAEAVADALDAASTIVQIKQVFVSTDFSTSSTSMVDVTNATVSITPVSTNNRLLYWWFAAGTHSSTNGAGWSNVYRGADLGEESIWVNAYANGAGGAGGQMFDEVVPATSAQTVKLRARTNLGTLTIQNCGLIVMEYQP